MRKPSVVCLMIALNQCGGSSSSHVLDDAGVRVQEGGISQDAAQHVQEGGTMPRTFRRKEWVDNILGMSEAEFRTKYNWKKGVPIRFSPQEKSDFVKGDPRRAALFQGQFKIYTLAELDRIAKANPGPFGAKARFRIALFDPLNDRSMTDVRYIQAHPENKRANVQIASTLFGSLEGGMIQESAHLTHMIYGVQGEEASISAGGAALHRKYIEWPYVYLLQNLPKIPLKTGSDDQSDLEYVKTQTFSDADMAHVAIGLHRDVVVTSGYGERGEGMQEELPIVLNAQGEIDTDKTQIISQTFTAVFNLTGQPSPMDPNLTAAAKVLQKASYEATLKTSAVTRQPKHFLTLMGGGVFNNPIGWIADAIDRKEIQDWIADRKLDVTLVYRENRSAAANPALRGAAEDGKFLKRLVKLSDAINGTSFATDPEAQKLIDDYTQAAYGTDKSLYSQRSQALQKKLNFVFN